MASVQLVFIGSKIFIADALGITRIPPAVSLSVTFSILAAGVGWSLWKTGEERGSSHVGAGGCGPGPLGSSSLIANANVRNGSEADLGPEQINDVRRHDRVCKGSYPFIRN